MRSSSPLFIILQAIYMLQAVYAGPSQRRVATQATFGSINNFQSVFKSEIQEAADQIKVEAKEQAAILSNLFAEISNATLVLIDNLLEDFKEFDVSESAALFSLAVENALTQLQQSPEYLFDIHTVVLQVQEDMEDILKFASQKTPDDLKHTQLLSQMVQNSVKSNFGIEFFQVQNLELSLADTHVKSSENQIIGSQEIMQLLRLDDAEGAKKMFERVLMESSQSEVVNAIFNSLKEAQLLEILIDTMVLIFSDEDFPIQPFSIALGVAFQDFRKGISELVGKVIIQMRTQNSKEGMAEALAFALAQAGSSSEMFELALQYAVQEAGCTSVAQLLVQAQEQATKNDVLEPFQNAIQQDARLFECKKVGEELSVTVKILKVLDEPEKAFAVIQEAVRMQQDAAIATSIIEGIGAGKQAEVGELLKLLFTDGNIPKEQLNLQLSLILTSGNKMVTKQVIKAVEQLKQDELQFLADAIFSSLLSGNSGQEVIFINLLGESVEEEKCSMKKVLDVALREASKQKISQVVQIISDNPEIGPCIDLSLTSAPPSENHPKLIDVPPPTLPAAVPETLTLSPLHIGPSTEIVLQFSSVLSDMNDYVADEVGNVANQESPQVEIQGGTRISPSPPQTSGSKNEHEDCDDISPPGTFTCAQQAKFGKCVRGWMQAGGFCRKTCGQCSSSQTVQQDPRMPTWMQAAVVHSPAVLQFIEPNSNIEGEKCVVDEDLLLKVAKLAVEEYLKSTDKQEAQ